MRNSPFSRRTCAGLQEIVAIILIGHFAVSAAAQTKPPAPQIQQFLGTWTAVHAGTPIIVLHLRLKEGKLAGDVQVCSYTISTQTTGNVDVVTDPTLSRNLPIKNVKVSADSVSFEWTDPDGDTDHWSLQLTGKVTGKIVWIDLPADIKVQPIPVSKV